MNEIYSSREIEKACRNDIRFMWILQNSPVPDHATIAHFQNERLSAAMEKLFYQLVLKLFQDRYRRNLYAYERGSYAKRAAKARIQCSNCCRKRVHCGRRTVPEPNRYAYADSVS